MINKRNKLSSARSSRGDQDPGLGQDKLHQPVMADEVLEHLKLSHEAIVVDATLGLGGHAAAILAHNPAAKVIGLDRDPGALKLARERLAEYGPRLKTIQANFASLARQAAGPVDGVLMDLGISSWQLAERGFSFQPEMEALLDFRLNPDDEVTAAGLVAQLPERELADLIYRFGEEHRSRRIAKAIIAARRQQAIVTTTQLAQIVEQAVGRRGRIHPATKTFQALRIAVNDELGSLQRGLEAAEAVLKPGGRLVVISFHSLEDRLIKQFVRGSAHLQSVTKHVIKPTPAEVRANPRARSAKLRVAEKL